MKLLQKVLNNGIFFGKGVKHSLLRSPRNRATTFANFGCLPTLWARPHKVGMRSSTAQKCLGGVSVVASHDSGTELAEARYEIHFAPEKKPPFFEPENEDSWNSSADFNPLKLNGSLRQIHVLNGANFVGSKTKTDSFLTTGSDVVGHNHLSSSGTASSSLEKSYGSKGVVPLGSVNPLKVIDDTFEFQAFSTHRKALKFSSEVDPNVKIQRKAFSFDQGPRNFPPSEPGDVNFVFPHDDLKSSLLLRPFEMYPNERNYVGKTDNFSIKIASSAQIERVGTREKTETREGRRVRVRYGEVENSETVSYKDFKQPHRGGLYCDRTFGPVKSWVCTHPGCVDTKKGPISRKGNDEFLGAPDGRGKYRELRCSVCGNGLYPSTLRRYRMGYIHLYQPLVHVSYIHSRQNLFAHLLRWKTREVHSLIYNNLNLINFGHTELFSACFAPLFGFCEDSLGEALEWLRGDYFSLSDQASVVLRLLQPHETRTAERISKEQRYLKKWNMPFSQGAEYAQRSAEKQGPWGMHSLGIPKVPNRGSQNSFSDEELDWGVEPSMQGANSSLDVKEGSLVGSGKANFANEVANDVGKWSKKWFKNWPPKPDPQSLATAWENSQSFPKKIESLRAPEFMTVDTLLLEDQTFLTDLVTHWKKILTVPKSRDLGHLEKLQLEIFEHDYHSRPGFRPGWEDRSLQLHDDWSEDSQTSANDNDIISAYNELEMNQEIQPLFPQKSPFQALTLDPKGFDFSEGLDFPKLEVFYEQTFETLESFLKNPEMMYSEKFTKNSFFLLLDFVTKFQAQFFRSTCPEKTSAFQQSGPPSPLPVQRANSPNKPFFSWNTQKFSSSRRFLNFVCFRKAGERGSGFSISPMKTENLSSSLGKVQNLALVEDFQKALKNLDKLLMMSGPVVATTAFSNQFNPLAGQRQLQSFVSNKSGSGQKDWIFRKAEWYGRGWGEPIPRAVGGFFTKKIALKNWITPLFGVRDFQSEKDISVSNLEVTSLGWLKFLHKFGYHWGRETWIRPPNYEPRNLFVPSISQKRSKNWASVKVGQNLFQFKKSSVVRYSPVYCPKDFQFDLKMSGQLSKSRVFFEYPRHKELQAALFYEKTQEEQRRRNLPLDDEESDFQTEIYQTQLPPVFDLSFVRNCPENSLSRIREIHSIAFAGGLLEKKSVKVFHRDDGDEDVIQLEPTDHKEVFGHSTEVVSVSPLRLQKVLSALNIHKLFHWSFPNWLPLFVPVRITSSKKFGTKKAQLVRHGQLNIHIFLRPKMHQVFDQNRSIGLVSQKKQIWKNGKPPRTSKRIAFKGPTSHLSIGQRTLTNFTNRVGKVKTKQLKFLKKRMLVHGFNKLFPTPRSRILFGKSLRQNGLDAPSRSTPKEKWSQRSWQMIRFAKLFQFPIRQKLGMPGIPPKTNLGGKTHKVGKLETQRSQNPPLPSLIQERLLNRTNFAQLGILGVDAFETQKQNLRQNFEHRAMAFFATQNVGPKNWAKAMSRRSSPRSLGVQSLKPQKGSTERKIKGTQMIAKSVKFTNRRDSGGSGTPQFHWVVRQKGLVNLTPFQRMMKISESQTSLPKSYMLISGIAQAATRPRKRVSKAAKLFELSLPPAHPGFAQNLVSSLELSTPSQIKFFLQAITGQGSKSSPKSLLATRSGGSASHIKKLTKGLNARESGDGNIPGLSGSDEIGRSKVKKFDGDLFSGNPFNSLKRFERSRIFDRTEVIQECEDSVGPKNWKLEKSLVVQFLSQENQFHNLMAFVKASPLGLKKQNRFVQKIDSLFFNPCFRCFIARFERLEKVGSGTLSQGISSANLEGPELLGALEPAKQVLSLLPGARPSDSSMSPPGTTKNPISLAERLKIRSWNFSPRGTISEGDPLYGWLPSEHMIQRLIKLLGNASLGPNGPELLLSQKPVEIFKLKAKKTHLYSTIFTKLFQGKPLTGEEKKAKLREFKRSKSLQVDKDGTRFALGSFHRQLQHLLFQKQSREGFTQYHCEEGATILSQTSGFFRKQTGQSEGGQSTKKVPGVESPIQRLESEGSSEFPPDPETSFVQEPEYDLNLLFDLKSPDDFGPWKRWPEFAKFFLYNGGPTLKKYFRSENWPKTALVLRKRIRRADPSVVFTKKISKLFETPQYMGISPEKWQSFQFFKPNRTKPGVLKEKVTVYFRDQRKLLLKEEKRLEKNNEFLQNERFSLLAELKTFDTPIAQANRFVEYKEEREKAFKEYKKNYRKQEKIDQRMRAQEKRAKQRLRAQKRKEFEKQQKAFLRAQLKARKEKEKLEEKERKEKEKLRAKALREKQKQEAKKLSQRQTTKGKKTITDLTLEVPNSPFPTEIQPQSEAQSAELTSLNSVRFEEGEGKTISDLEDPSHLSSPDFLATLPLPPELLEEEEEEEEKVLSDAELFDHFVKFEYPPYKKLRRKDIASRKDYLDLFKFSPEELENLQEIAALRAKRKSLRPHLLYLDPFNIEKVFEDFPFSAEDIGWSTDPTENFSNKLSNPLWRNFLMHEMFRRNSQRDQKKVVKKDLMWEDFHCFLKYPLNTTSLQKNLPLSPTSRGCLSRMNALIDFDHAVKRYDLTTRKADHKKADQYYQRFQEYLNALRLPTNFGHENIEMNPNFPLKKRTRKISEKKRLVKHYRAVLSLLKNPSCIERGVFEKFPILPPDLRPILQIGDVKAVSDITALYILLIQRNLRHGKILFESYGESNEFLIDSKTMVQVAADNVLDKCREKNLNSLIVGRMWDYKESSTQLEQWASARPKTKGPGSLAGPTPPRTLYDRLSGKEGRFRMNLLGKRVDYSGRSVIIVGPSLRVHQCGLPYEMAFELFQPFVLRYMLEDPEKKVQKYLEYDPWIPDETVLDHLKSKNPQLFEAGTIKSLSQAKLILRKKKALGRMILRQIVPNFPVLLNRAPTLHRLGIQGFYPVLVYGRALHLHPLVCGSFNADFDGDQMAIHIPLSLKARFDIRMLMFAPVNWLSPATGQPTVVPSQDMVLGLFYMTLEKIAFQKGRGAFFQTLSDAVQAYETGMVEIQSQIWLKWNGPFANSQMNEESSPEVYDEPKTPQFQFRRKPFFPENQILFWGSSGKLKPFSEKETNELARVPSDESPSTQILSKKDLRLLRRKFHASTFGTAGEMTVMARWWHETADTRLFSSAFSGPQKLGSPKRPSLGEEQGKKDIRRKGMMTGPILSKKFSPSRPKVDWIKGSGFSYRSVKESWYETVRRQQRRRHALPVKYSRKEGFFYHSFGRFANDEDEPIEIRLHQNGNSRKIYSDFQWFEDSKEEERNCYIRTTPGRALINQLIYPAYEELDDQSLRNSIRPSSLG